MIRVNKISIIANKSEIKVFPVYYTVVYFSDLNINIFEIHENTYHGFLGLRKTQPVKLKLGLQGKKLIFFVNLFTGKEHGL